VSSSLGCVEINLYLHRAADGELVLAGVRGCSVHGKGHRLKIGTEGMAGHVAATRQMLYAPDVALDPYYIACEADTRSEVAIPLQVEGELVGVFTASIVSWMLFSTAHLRLLQGLCSQCRGRSAELARFHDERKRREHMTREAEEQAPFNKLCCRGVLPAFPASVSRGCRSQPEPWAATGTISSRSPADAGVLSG